MIAPSRIAIVLLPLLAAAEGASAASAVCDRLQAKLADLPQVVSNAPRPAMPEIAGGLSRLNLDLRSARIALRRMGCSSGSIIVVGGPNEEECAALEGRVAGLEDELGALKERRRAANGADIDATRDMLQAALSNNGCLQDQDTVIEASSTASTEPRNILKNLPEVDENLPFIGDDHQSILVVPGDGRGPYRTMCVRTCDGAFFPITSNATPADFGRDAASCAARCPGAETELYFHNLMTEESDQMVSTRTGRPYQDLPNAFAYRTRDRSVGGQCGCRLPAAAKSDTVKPQQTTPAATAVPNGTVEPSAETQAASPEATAAGTVASTALRDTTQYERPYMPNNHRVRVVGPTFLPSEESRIDLKNPAGPAYQPVQN